MILKARSKKTAHCFLSANNYLHKNALTNVGVEWGRRREESHCRAVADRTQLTMNKSCDYDSQFVSKKSSEMLLSTRIKWTVDCCRLWCNAPLFPIVFCFSSSVFEPKNWQQNRFKSFRQSKLAFLREASFSLKPSPLYFLHSLFVYKISVSN